MGVLLNADTDYLSRTGGPASTGLINWTIWGWHRRTSGVGYSAAAGGSIFAQEGNAGRHMVLKFDNTFGSGTEADPRLVVGDNGGETAFGSGHDHPSFDTWTFFVLTVAGPAGSAAMTAEWTQDDGSTWHTGTRTGATEDSITAQTLLIGQAVVGDANTSRGDYAYVGVRAEAMDQTARRALLNRSATASGDWAYWRLANSTDTADTSGNSRTLTFTGSIDNGADPTIPGGGGAAASLLVPQYMGAMRTLLTR